MKYSNTIEYNITTKLDSSGLTKMQNQIREIELSLQRMGDKQGGFFSGQVEQARKELQGLNKALTEAFNPSLGIIDISKFRAELAKGKVDSEGLASAFRLAGTDGQVAFNNLISQLGTFDAGMQRTSSAVDKMWLTFQNTFRWGLVSSFFSQFMNAVHSSIDYVKELDDSLTQIMLVTDYNRDSMNQFAKSANEAAKAVSMTTTGMTNASLVFAQQGYDLGQSQELATLSAKLANASQQDTATTSDQITAYMNAYGLENSIEELTQQMDNWALIANVSAADVSELAKASQRAASMANTVGVNSEQLAAQIATIESVTREAPEQIGNGLKTLYARFSDISQGGEDEDGISLGDVTKQLNDIGVQILDQFGNIRDVGDIMEDLMVIWDDLDRTSKVAVAQSLAGKYQVNRFVSLMDNSDMYKEYLGATGSAATGTLDTMNEEYADSIAGRTVKMQATLEGIFSSIFDTDAIYPFIDAMQTFLDLTQKFIEAIGGGGPVITGVIALIGRLFSKNIANAFVDTKINNNLSKIQSENYKNAPAAIAQLGLSNPNPENQNTKALLDFAQKGAEMAPNMSEQGLENYNRLLKENTQLSNQAAEAQQNFENVISKVNAELGINLSAKDSIIKDESGLNVTPLLDALQQASNDEQFGQSSEYWDSATKAVDSYATKLAEVHRELEEYRKIENPSQDITDKVKQKIQELKTELDALRGTSVQSSESIDQIEQTVDLLNGTLDETDKQTDDWKESLKDSSAEVERLQSNAGTLIKILEELSKTGGLKDKAGIEALLNELYAAQSKATATQGAAQGGQRQMTSFISDTEDVIKVKNIVDTTSAIGELAFAWQSFQHLGSLWSNEDLSAGEKLLQTIINITMAMSQLMPVMDKLNLGQKITGLFSSDETKNNLISLNNEINEITDKINKQKETQNSINQLEEKRNTLINQRGQIKGKLWNNDKKITDLGKQKLKLDGQIKAIEDQINEGKEKGILSAEALKALEDERNAKIAQRQILEKQNTAELAKQKMMSAALNIGLGIALAAIAAGIGAIQEQERQRIQKITDDAEDSRSKLEAITSSEFFEQWDSFKENGELTDELKDSMAALAQQMGINIEAQDIYAGNIEQLNDKIRDNIELEKERARINFETENEEFETQLNKKSIQAAQVGGTVTTASGTFDSAVDYIGQAGAAKSLAERLGEVANALSVVNAKRKEFGKDSLEYNNALNNYQKLRDQLKDDEVDIDKANSNFKQLADLAIEEFKAGKDAQSLTGADWINFLNSDGGAEVRDYMESLGEEVGLQFKLGLLSQSDAENPIYSMITAPGQFNLSKGNLSATESTEWDFSNLMQSGIDPSELLGAEAGTKTWDDFAQAFIDAANNDTITISPNIKLENKYDFDSEEEINKYLEDYTNIDRVTLDTATELRMSSANQENNYEGYNRQNGEAEYWKSQIENAQQDISDSTNIKDTIKATEELTEAQDKYNEALGQTKEDQALYEKALQRAAAASARMSKTLDEMNDHFDTNKEILEEGNTTTTEYAEALTETKEDLAGLLDVDLESIPNSLAQNPEILEDMNTLLHGTQEEAEAAYKEIQNIATGEIIDHLDIPVGLTDSDGNEITTEQVQSTLHGLIDSLNAQDLSIDMEADINTDEWYARVNELLASGALTAEQLTQVLSSAGYEGEFSTQPGKGWAQEIAYDLEVSGFDVPAINGPTDLNKLAGMSGHIKMTPTASKTVPIKTEVPILKGATQKGGFVNNAGGSGGRRSGGGGGGGRGGSCFIAGTLISTSLGFKPIEQIQKEDIVLSYNKSIGLNEYSKVLQTMIHDTTEPIYTLYIKDEQLRVTGIHRFLVTDKITCGIPQWVHAADLKVGQWVLFADGTWHVIHKIEVNIEHQIVYNFEVSHNHNYYVGHNQILVHNKGGKGGGGGSGKATKPKTAEKKEAEEYQKKYYEEVDHQLDKVDKTLDKVEKTTDKLIGTQARTKQNEQIKLLQKELTLQQKKLKILQEQEKVDVSNAIKKADKDFEDLLKKQGINFNLLDFTFDEEGFIDNLDPVRESIANGINKLNNQYNAIIGDDGEVSDGEQERLKALDEEIQKLQKLGKEVEKNGTRYNEIVIEEQKIQNEMQEIQDQMQDIAIDAYKASQEAIDNLKDLRKEWAEFSAGLYDSSKGESFLSLDNPIRQLKEIENEISSIYAVSGTEARKYYDDIIAQQQKYLENAKTADEQQAYKDAIEYYEKLRDSIDDGAVLNNGLMQLALNDLTRLQEIWNNWNDEGGNGFFGDDKAALEKALEDAQKRVMEFAQDFEELIEDLKDASLDVVDHTMEQWDRQLDRYDRVIDQLDRYSDTYSLIYGDASYDMQEAVLSQQAQTLKSELDAAQEAYLAANTYYLEAYEKFVDKSTGLAKEGYEDYMYELEEAMNDAEDKVRDIAADAAEKFSEAFEAAVMASTQYILRNTIGENDFEHSDRNWEWDKEYIDKYKDGVEKAYEMDKLRNRYIDMLNNAQGASLQTQNKIRAQMQEQLDLLDGQKTVSEYDVKLANAKLEILQKQIALEDAQRNKNKMQLRRDTQGNYRYVYTADKDNVDQAQQELLDSEYDAYEMSKQQQMNNYDDMINAYKRYLSQREEILTNNNLSETQKMEQIKELWDRFQKYVNAAQEDFGDATAGTVDILQWLVVNGTDYTATAATDMLNQLLDAEGNVAEQSGVIWMDLANNMANEVIPSIANVVTTADDVIEQKLVQTGIALVGEDGTGGVFGEVSNGANDFGDQCEMAANQTAILAEQSNKLKEALLGDSDAFVETQGKLASYQKQLEDVAEASSNTARALRDTQTALDKANAEKLNYKTQIDRLLSGQDIIVDHKIVDAEEYRRQQEEEKRKQQQRNSGGGGGRNALADARAIWYHGAWGNGGDWYTPYSRQFGTAAANKVLWYFNHGYGYNFDFDTGGYTGEWNQGEGVSSHKNGKLAFLHQKELILNAQDTENILSAVSMVRSLANSAQASMNNINTAASSNINSIYNPVTEQRVDIQASFPNATDAEDIRQALIGLSDRAYQYAHRVI